MSFNVVKIPLYYHSNIVDMTFNIAELLQECRFNSFFSFFFMVTSEAFTIFLFKNQKISSSKQEANKHSPLVENLSRKKRKRDGGVEVVEKKENELKEGEKLEDKEDLPVEEKNNKERDGGRRM